MSHLQHMMERVQELTRKAEGGDRRAEKTLLFGQRYASKHDLSVTVEQDTPTHPQDKE